MHAYLRVGGGFVVLLAQDCWNEQWAVGVTIPPLRGPRVDRVGVEPHLIVAILAQEYS